MKKVFLFLALLLPFIFTGCDDINFGLQELYNTYLIFDGEEKDEVSVFCKSEKLKISEMKECKEITDENIIGVLKQNDLIVDGTSPKIFYVPHNQRIMDHKKVDLFFKVTINQCLLRSATGLLTKLPLRGLLSEEHHALFWEHHC